MSKATIIVIATTAAATLAVSLTRLRFSSERDPLQCAVSTATKARAALMGVLTGKKTGRNDNDNNIGVEKAHCRGNSDYARLYFAFCVCYDSWCFIVASERLRLLLYVCYIPGSTLDVMSGRCPGFDVHYAWRERYRLNYSKRSPQRAIFE